VTIRWRRDAGEIHFEKNDQELGIAFTKISSTIDLYPAMMVHYDHGMHMSFVSS
jgi:hypothetical protein